MRMIGQLDGEAKARAFSDYLYVQGIDNQIEAEKEGSWTVWIHAEEELERARELLARFLENPADPTYRNTGAAANELREKKKQEQAAYEKRLKQGRQLFRPMSAYGFGPLTAGLILASVAVFVLSKYSTDFKPIYGLFISERDVPGVDGLSLFSAFFRRLANFHEILPEIRSGEVWRLFTPMFIHMSFLHIFFNMLWLRDLGSMIEGRQNSLVLLTLVLATAAFSDVAQYLVGGPAFGGMSGVVYGLVGYIWIRGKFDPASGLYLNNSTLVMMIVWFFVCLIGITGVANTCHAAGLLLGMAWGYLSSLRRR